MQKSFTPMPEIPTWALMQAGHRTKACMSRKRSSSSYLYRVETWAIRLKDQDRVIGSIGLEHDKYRPDANSKELGYSLAEEFWRQGIMTEAAKEVIRFGFEELALEQIGICTGTANIRSQSVIRKCGFKYEGTIRRTYKIYDGTLRDSMVYSLLKEEYEAMKEKEEQ